MFADASALTTILASEEGAAELLSRMQRAGQRYTSPIAVWETAVAISRILDLEFATARKAVFDYLAIAEIELLAVPPEAAALALEAFERFGKGQHPARLNMGDCFAYACARHFGEPLLFKGDDFPRTDVDPA